MISTQDSLALYQKAKEQESIRWYWWRNLELGVRKGEEGKQTKERITKEGTGKKAEQRTKGMNGDSYETSQVGVQAFSLSVLYITAFVQNNMQIEYNSKIVIN